MPWQNIPMELRQRAQWIVSGPSRIPHNPRTGELSSPVDPSTWGTYEEAIATGQKHIGYVLAPWDPYTIIDLDDKEDRPATEEQKERHRLILSTFESYTERSAGGRGYHIIVKGQLPIGGVRSRDHVEIYSYAHYLICTGDVIRQAPIVDYQELLLRMFEEMAPEDRIELEELDETINDKEIVDMATGAENAEKFNTLCRGEWETMGYPSQSEADLALLSIISFYSQSNEQVRRIFRMSELGRRDKSIRNDKYINYALEKIRAKQPPLVDFEAIKRSFSENRASEGGSSALDNHHGRDEKQIKNGHNNGTSAKVLQLSAPTEPPTNPDPDLPPGIVGELAQYFYQSSIRPVPDIALVSAIAITSGVIGRSYNISKTGLNQYLILVAKTGSGKEAISSGIDSLMEAVRVKVPMIDQFVGPSAFASGQAMIKVLDERPCFVSVLGEFGFTLQQLCDPNAPPAQITLKKVLLALYQKSGFDSILRSSVYSDIEKNTKEVRAPNMTIVGETTPETFFDSLDATHIADGLIPRFIIVQYDGKRPPRNLRANFPPPEGLVRKFTDLASIALSTQQNNTCGSVSTDSEAQKMLDTFDKEADTNINEKGSTDSVIQIWNRAHLKALKLSALLAVGVNPHEPVVTPVEASWAINFIRRDVGLMTEKFKSGDVGRGDSKISAEIRRTITAFFDVAPETLQKYGVDIRMVSDKVIPYKYLVKRTASLASFKSDKRGSTMALKIALQDLVEQGMLQEVPVQQMWQRYATRSKAWICGGNW